MAASITPLKAYHLFINSAQRNKPCPEDNSKAGYSLLKFNVRAETKRLLSTPISVPLTGGGPQVNMRFLTRSLACFQHAHSRSWQKTPLDSTDSADERPQRRQYTSCKTEIQTCNYNRKLGRENKNPYAENDENGEKKTVPKTIVRQQGGGPRPRSTREQTEPTRHR
ncbi:hypothetical protein GX48_04856 [Paracoccidioides brasiliensis]|nr:hypothetical protein GX48_04856 [Paracoccidioides brasiliensis]